MQNLNKSINDADKSTTKLRDNLDKVDIKMQDISVSAKDIVKVFDTKFLSALQNIVAETSKLSATITELHSHVEKAIAKNVEEGEKLAEKMEESGKKSLSAIEVKAIEVQTLFENVGSTAAEKIEQISEQMNEQAVEVSKSLDTINEKYEKESKNIGLFNLKGHKENVQAHIEELNKYKQAIEESRVRTSALYDISAKEYDKDSAEFKKVQDEKAVALQKLEAEIGKVDAKLKESNDSYLAVWQKQHGTIGAELEASTTKLDTAINKQLKTYDSIVEGFDKAKVKLNEGIDKQAAREKDLNESRYKKKNEKLDKELANLREEVAKQEDEKKRLEKEQNDAKEKKEKAEADIKKIKEHFTKKLEKTSDETTETDTTLPINDTPQTENENIDGNSSEEVEWLGTEDEIAAAQERIDELQAIADQEAKIYDDKKDKIDEVNDKIIDGERSVLLEQMRISDEKTKLAEEKTKKDAEIAEKAAKQKEKLEKLQKIKDKAQAVVNIAKAVGSVAKGVATAWGYGPFIGPPMAALVAIQGAMQIKTMTQQLKYMEDGGLLNGKRHNQGGMRIQGTNIEVEGGEYVVNRESTNKNLGLINYINSQRRELDSNDLHTFFGQPFSIPTFSPPSFMAEMQRGGHIPSFEPNVDITNSELLEGMSKIKIEPRVSVTDINTVHENMVKVDEWTGL